MDWAEDLKLTLKRSAKMGRRAAAAVTTAAAAAASSSSATKSNSSSMDKPGSGSSISSPPAELDPTSSFENEAGQILDEYDLRQLSKSKKIGGWADEPVKLGKLNKTNTNLIEQERFNSVATTTTTATTNYSDDDNNIQVIPDLDDIRDELILNEMVEAPIVTVNRVATYNELNIDLQKMAPFALLEYEELNILAQCMESEEQLNEPDDVWQWDRLFTEISAEINTENPLSRDTNLHADVDGEMARLAI